MFKIPRPKMVVKVYISGISASKEVSIAHESFFGLMATNQKVKKQQQRALLVLDSLRLDYEAIDVTEPGMEEERERIKEVCKKRNGNVPLPPQFFNGDEYCGVSSL